MRSGNTGKFRHRKSSHIGTRKAIVALGRNLVVAAWKMLLTGLSGWNRRFPFQKRRAAGILSGSAALRWKGESEVMVMLRRLVALILLLYRGMCECLRDCSDFESFQKQVRGRLTKAGCEILSIIFEALDERLMRERDPNLRVVGFRERTIVTIFGEMKFRRRLYEDRVTGETRRGNGCGSGCSNGEKTRAAAERRRSYISRRTA